MPIKLVTLTRTLAYILTNQIQVLRKKRKSTLIKDITLRRLTIFDITAIVAIEAMVSKNPWGSSLLINEMNQKGFIGFAACFGEEKIVGYALWQIIKGEFEFRKIAVATEFQNSGIGLKLSRQLLACAKKQKITRVFLEVGIENISAQKLYKKVGLKKLSVRKKYYNNKEDALILSMSYK